MDTKLAEEYMEMQKKDVRLAFQTVREDVIIEQGKLKRINPQNPLLYLVRLNSHDHLAIDRRFKPILFEHTEVKKSDNIYYALGMYVELLKQEQLNPKFLPRN